MTETMVFSLTIVSVLVVLLGILRLRHVSLQVLVLGLIGAIVGLLLGALASVPLSKLPQPLGEILPIGASVIFTIVTMGVVLSRRNAFLKMLPFMTMEDTSAAPATAATTAQRVLVDTSVIIDGRIADIAEAGFVPGVLVVPRFVLAELQNIADSDDAMRRGRGRRGLEVLNRLRDMPDVTVEITEEDAQGIKEVDAKLVALAQRFSCHVLTTDYNLNRVAAIQGVRVLNVNELSNAIRPVVLPGEQLMVRVVQPGKERNQGVGYLADGTMIVVENGDKLMGQEVATEVTRVFQTVAGKMIIAAPKKGVVMPETRPTPAQSQPAVSQPAGAPEPSEPSPKHTRTHKPKPNPSHKQPATHDDGARAPKPPQQANTPPQGNNRHGSDRGHRQGQNGQGGQPNQMSQGGTLNPGSSHSLSSRSIEDRIIQQNRQQ